MGYGNNAIWSKKSNIIRASEKRKGRAAALLNIFYFSLYDIGMARKSAHRFGFHDFHNFKA